MTVFTIENRKEFMHLLLRTDTFDGFLISEGEVRTCALFRIDCHLSKGFFNTEELQDLGLLEGDPLPYSMLRDILFSLIRGKQSPVSLKLVLSLPKSSIRELILSSGAPIKPEELSGLFLNLHYQNGALRVSTGVGYLLFSRDRALEDAWDASVRKFLSSHSVLFTETS